MLREKTTGKPCPYGLNRDLKKQSRRAAAPEV